MKFSLRRQRVRREMENVRIGTQKLSAGYRREGRMLHGGSGSCGHKPPAWRDVTHETDENTSPHEEQKVGRRSEDRSRKSHCGVRCRTFVFKEVKYHLIIDTEGSPLLLQVEFS